MCKDEEGGGEDAGILTGLFAANGCFLTLFFVFRRQKQTTTRSSASAVTMATAGTKINKSCD